jgi:hypothetical protein
MNQKRHASSMAFFFAFTGDGAVALSQGQWHGKASCHSRECGNLMIYAFLLRFRYFDRKDRLLQKILDFVRDSVYVRHIYARSP